MTVPVDAYTKGVKYPAAVTFDGYAANFGQPRPPLKAGPKDRIRFSINAHGYELGREKEYYTEFCNSVKSAGRDYAFDKVQNSNPDQAYFSGMTVRPTFSITGTKRTESIRLLLEVTRSPRLPNCRAKYVIIRKCEILQQLNKESSCIIVVILSKWPARERLWRRPDVLKDVNA